MEHQLEIMYHPVSSDIILYHPIMLYHPRSSYSVSSYIIRYHPISRYIVLYHRASSYIMLSYIIQYHPASSDIMLDGERAACCLRHSRTQMLPWQQAAQPTVSWCKPIDCDIEHCIVTRKEIEKMPVSLVTEMN